MAFLAFFCPAIPLKKYGNIISCLKLFKPLTGHFWIKSISENYPLQTPGGSENSLQGVVQKFNRGSAKTLQGVVHSNVIRVYIQTYTGYAFKRATKIYLLMIHLLNIHLLIILLSREQRKRSTQRNFFEFVDTFCWHFRFVENFQKWEKAWTRWYITVSRLFIWSEWRDSNPWPLGPEPSAIPNFATPRSALRIIYYCRGNCKSFFQ